ncbi:hypothetical protein Esti_001164 [Eimeria stiedai]
MLFGGRRPLLFVRCTVSVSQRVTEQQERLAGVVQAAELQFIWLSFDGGAVTCPRFAATKECVRRKHGGLWEMYEEYGLFTPRNPFFVV